MRKSRLAIAAMLLASMTCGMLAGCGCDVLECGEALRHRSSRGARSASSGFARTGEGLLHVRCNVAPRPLIGPIILAVLRIVVESGLEVVRIVGRRRIKRVSKRIVPGFEFVCHGTLLIAVRPLTLLSYPSTCIEFDTKKKDWVYIASVLVGLSRLGDNSCHRE